MSETKVPIEALDFKADSYSPDGKTIIVSMATKHVPERQTFSLPVASLYGFIADLQRLRSGTPGEPPVSPANPPPAPLSSEPPKQVTAKDQFRINITVPQRWMMRSGLPERPLIYLVFDAQTDRQAGFGLGAATGREMAASLVKYADVLEQHEAARARSS